MNAAITTAEKRQTLLCHNGKATVINRTLHINVPYSNKLTSDTLLGVLFYHGMVGILCNRSKQWEGGERWREHRDIVGEVGYGEGCVNGQIIHWGWQGTVIPQEEWPVESMWSYVIGWSKNIKGASFAYLGAAGTRGRKLTASWFTHSKASASLKCISKLGTNTQKGHCSCCLHSLTITQKVGEPFLGSPYCLYNFKGRVLVNLVNSGSSWYLWAFYFLNLNETPLEALKSLQASIQDIKFHFRGNCYITLIKMSTISHEWETTSSTNDIWQFSILRHSIGRNCLKWLQYHNK